MHKITGSLGFALAVGFLSCLFGAGQVRAQALSHFPDPIFHDGYNGFASTGTANVRADDAARFLAQATFGPTDADIASVRSLGYVGWLNQQFAATPTYEITDRPGKVNSAYLNWVQNVLQEDVGQNNRQEAWFQGALGGKDPQFPTNASYNHTDQLRQRVAFALSEILVISDQNPTLAGYARGMAAYYDLLIKNAFGNYRQLLQDVTVSPAMGEYLNTVGNRRADLSQNVHPDENYGREVNQLFGVGLVLLNLDGTPQLDGNGKPIPTYGQDTITNFAHVFTGWNWADCDKNYDYPNNAPPVWNGTYSDHFTDCFSPYQEPDAFLKPMIAFDVVNYPDPGDPSYHDNGTDAVNDFAHKQLLYYSGAAMSAGESSPGTLGPGGSAASDLAFALDNIFNHPNVAPFIAKQLIMRLVTSNPTPAYVARVAKIFNDNRASSTQLQAVVQAILLDPEARYGQFHNPESFGKLREPLLTLTHFWRAMGAQHKCGNNIAATGNSSASLYANQPYRYAGYGTAWSTGQSYAWGVGVHQAALDAPTVFNFFKPSFVPSGEMSTRGMVGPEFQIATDSIVASTNNTFASYALYGNYDLAATCDPSDDFGDVMVNYAQDKALAGSANGGSADPSDRLVDAYNIRFMSGQMSPFMRDQLVSYLNTIDSTWDRPNGTDWRLLRVYRALYLVLTSPEYMVQK
ncbi:MAG: DUF1800 family protein [Proteobacteria bacterium]|nr:DUF1800 family protein [Pseudomonadota bacterium]